METKNLPVKNLALYLGNYRTLPQPDEASAIHAIVFINPERFWALVRSLISGGYLPSENILVLKGHKGKTALVVREGNRRIAALKLILGLATRSGLPVPEDVETAISNIGADWKKKNSSVPCAVYDASEKDIVENIVGLIHGKGEEASRLEWTSVATARHNRDENGIAEPALDLLEKYLKDGRNLTSDDREQWAADYHLSLLKDMISRLAAAHGLPVADFVKQYPAVKHRNSVEQILHEVGKGSLTFTNTRSGNFIAAYGMSPPPPSASTPTQAAAPAASGSPPAPAQPQSPGASPAKAAKPTAYPLNDPRSVYKSLRKFIPKGGDRSKVASFLVEMRRLKLDKHPLSFCFLLRGIFEISAKAYCGDHSLSVTANGQDRKLIDVLTDVANHLTNNMDRRNPLTKPMHGAMAELGRKTSFLSVTSMNLLVHSPTFSVDERHISTEFNNVFPLLQAMNR